VIIKFFLALTAVARRAEISRCLRFPRWGWVTLGLNATFRASSHPLGNLGITYSLYVELFQKLYFQQAFTAEAIRAEICLSRRYLRKWVTSSAHIK